MTDLCATCVHWVATDRWEAQAAGFGLCSKVERGWYVADEASANVAHDYDDVGYPGQPDYAPGPYMAARANALKAAKAAVWDGSEYMAELLTGHDFGCVLHASNPATAQVAGEGE